MSAQLILIPLVSKEAGSAPDRPRGDEKPASSPVAVGGAEGSAAQPSGDSGQSAGASPDIPPWRQLPIGMVKVFGQAPNHFGDFDSISALLHSLHKAGLSEKLPGGSNTVFATVKDLTRVERKSLDDELARFPGGLTIVVSPKSRDSVK